jgi:hypothetical protein
MTNFLYLLSIVIERDSTPKQSRLLPPPLKKGEAKGFKKIKTANGEA